ncbi:MAG: V-type ATP synthase subunit F [Victivallales bacterium]|nr:V-type ATP synthase subunit F [Victivallales bacterium]
MSSSYHIIGDQDTVLGYRFAGVTGDAVSTPEEARAAFAHAIRENKPGVLLITEAVEEMIPEEVTAHRKSVTPPFLATVPDIWGARNKRKSLAALIGEAVGIKIVDSGG